MLKYNLIFFVGTHQDLKQLQNFLQNNNFKVSNIQKYNSSYIMGVSFKYKTILELLYLVVLSSYYCNTNNLHLQMLVNNILNKVSNNLITIFNSIKNYKIKIQKDTYISINKNILNTDIKEKNEVINKNIKNLLYNNTHLQNFFYFISNIKNKTKNIHTKKYLINFLSKFNYKNVEVKKETVKKEVEVGIKEIFSNL